MNDLTLHDFCQKFGACKDGYLYGIGLTTKGKDAMMSEVWPLMDNWDYMRWVIGREGVLTKKERVALAVRFIRETPLHDGRKVYDLLKDERSIKAIEVCDRYVKGEATDDELRNAAYAAATAYAADAAAAYAAYAAADAAAADAAYAAADAADAKLWQIEILKSIPNPFVKESY